MANYLQLYVAEFEFRYNNRKNHDIFGAAIGLCQFLTHFKIIIIMTHKQDTTTTNITKRTNQNGGNMSIGLWSSLQSASFWYDTASVIFLISLAVGVVTALLIYLAGNAKEEYLRRNIANTMERAAIAEQRAAEANQKAEEERLARVKIEEKIAPRMLSSVQFGNLRNKIIEFASMPIDVCVFPEGSSDIIPLSHEITHVLQAAKWDVLMFTAIGTGANVIGIWVSISNRSDITVKSAAKLLISALNSEGIITKELVPFPEEHLPFTHSSENKLHLNRKQYAPIRIMIGTKP